MKKMMKIAAIAVVASLALVACKNNKVEEPIDTIDSTAIEQICDEIDSVIDTVDLAVVEEPAAPTVKKTTKKAAEPAETGVKVDNSSKHTVTTTDNSIKEGEATKVDNVKRTGRR